MTEEEAGLEEQLGKMGEAPGSRWRSKKRRAVSLVSRASPARRRRRRRAGRMRGDPGSWEQSKWSRTD